MKILILNGPNLNLLGQREVQYYGKKKLSEIESSLRKVSHKLGFKLEFKQSNHEGVLVKILQHFSASYIGIIFNAGAYTHTSLAIRDAILDSHSKIIEVHLSNVKSRGKIRLHSMIADVCIGSISGFGWRVYMLALFYFAFKINRKFY